MKDKVLHMIGNAHIDPVWLWQWQEGFQEVKSTFRSALDRMKESEDFIFTSSSAAYYEWVENNDPAMFAEIRERVAEGRWVIVGGWWVQPDCNIPSGESFVRQGLYGQRYFLERFGVVAKVGYNVDSFGHHGMLPQILKKSGMDYYVFMRPGPHEKGLPGHLFWWESDDGSRVLTFRILFEYCTWGKDVVKHVRRSAEELREPYNELMCFYGVGNHGGGPTKENLASIAQLNEAENLPILRMSSPNHFFESIESQHLPIPVVHDDLQHHASGCYAAHSGVKQWNRRAENLLLAAEKFSSLAASLTGQPYPRNLTEAWKIVLFNQFHDILAGTSLEAAYEDARDGYGESCNIASRALNYAVQSISWQIDIPEQPGVKPLVVFHPHAWPSRVAVEMETGNLPKDPVLFDERGNIVPLQRVQSQAAAHGRHRISFVAELPSFGYRTYRIAQRSTESPEMADGCETGDFWMENEWLRIEFSPDTGFVTKLVDKRTGHSVFRGDAARPVVMEDKSDTWSHNVLQFQSEIGVFKADSIKLVEQGPVKSVMRVRSTYGRSTLVQDFTMYKELDQIDVKVTLDWQEQWKALKLRFPIDLNFSEATYEIPYGQIVRPANGEEEPGQSWVDVTGQPPSTGEVYGVALLNDGKYSFDVHNKELSLTVLRSPIYAHHVPFVPENPDEWTFIDHGVQSFTYALVPHVGSWETARIVERALELNQPPIAVPETFHVGKLGQRESFLSVDCNNVVVTAIKQAEDGEDIVVRCVETGCTSAHAVLTMPIWNRKLEADFGPNEIKTFIIPKDETKPIRETNLLELDATQKVDTRRDKKKS